MQTIEKYHIRYGLPMRIAQGNIIDWDGLNKLYILTAAGVQKSSYDAVFICINHGDGEATVPNNFVHLASRQGKSLFCRYNL